MSISLRSEFLLLVLDPGLSSSSTSSNISRSAALGVLVVNQLVEFFTQLAVLHANKLFDFWTVSKRPSSHFTISTVSSPFYGAEDGAFHSSFKVKHTRAIKMQIQVQLNAAAAPGDSRRHLTVTSTAQRFPPK